MLVVVSHRRICILFSGGMSAVYIYLNVLCYLSGKTAAVLMIGLYDVDCTYMMQQLSLLCFCP